MVDTHAHLAFCEGDDADLVAAARAVGVRRILTVGLDEETNRAAIAAAGVSPEVFAAVGRHPNSAEGFDDAAAADILLLAAEDGVRAIGETGLDFYRDTAPRHDQRAAFAAQIGIARDTGLPLIIHVRDPAGGTSAVDEVFATLAAEAQGVAVVLHCFSAPARVGEAAERGWYCSFAGNVTYPKSETLREAAAEVPPELLLVETDSPFLSPQAHRGERNQPAHVVATAEIVADARGLPYEELERLVEENAARAFGW